VGVRIGKSLPDLHPTTTTTTTTTPQRQQQLHTSTTTTTTHTPQQQQQQQPKNSSTTIDKVFIMIDMEYGLLVTHPMTNGPVDHHHDKVDFTK
jgi:hypothetical protein